MPPPPWKKARLSRMVSDHLTSPTNGGSLVVETGFPTAVVDLFVKNRHRMKKTSSKKNSWTGEIDSEPADYLSPFSGEIFVTESVSSATTPRSPLDSLQSPRRSASESIPMNESIDQEKNSETVGECDGRGAETKGYSWSWWIFRAFFVVVLAMATKQLAVGITASASSLLLIELFVNYLLKPWLHARKSRKNNNHSSSTESQSKEVQIEESVDSNVAETPIPEPNTNLRLPSIEIRALKSILNSPRFHRRSASDGTGTAKDLHAYKSFNLNWFSVEESRESVETEDAGNQSELDQIPKPLPDHDDVDVPNQIVHKSRSRKIKSKIKKFVKKLRSSKKESTDQRDNTTYFAGSASEYGSIPSSIALLENNHQPTIDDGTSILSENSHMKELEDTAGLSVNTVQGRKVLRRRKSTYCVAIFAVVLAGLIGGRLSGIVFTLIWCAAMKLIIDKEGSTENWPLD